MADTENSHQLRNGLPHCISRDQQGFDRLKRILGLSRDTCRNLLDIARKNVTSFPKAKLSRRLSASERDRLLLLELYQDKTRRYKYWAHIFSLFESGKDKEIARKPPSLEHRLLTHHLNDFSTEKRDSLQSLDVFSCWPDLAQHLTDTVPWADFSAHAWAATLKRLSVDTWDALDPDQRAEVSMTVFSIATIVDDDRILRSAISAIPDLAAEYDDILQTPPVSDDVTETGAAPEDDSEIANIVEIEEEIENNESNEHDVLDRWTALCESLGSLANDAKGPPLIVDTLPQIRAVVDELSKIAQHAKERTAAAAFDHLISQVHAYLDDSSPQGFSWIGNTQRTNLNAAWEAERPSLSMKQIGEEFIRLEESVPTALKHIDDVTANLSTAQAKLDAFPTAPPDFASYEHWASSSVTLSEAVTGLRTDLYRAFLDLLSQLSPFGRPFSPNAPQHSPPDHDTPSSPPASAPEGDQPSTTTESAPSEPHEHDLDPPDAGSDEKPEPTAIPAPNESSSQLAANEVRPVESTEAPLTRRAADTDPAATKHPQSDDTDGVAATPTRRPTPAPDAEKPPIESGSPPEAPPARLIADALSESPPRLAYAAQVSALSERLAFSTDAPLAVLLKAAALADYLTSPDGTIAYALSGLLEGFSLSDSVEDKDDLVRDQYNMLALAAALRPTLLLPGPAALSILSSLSPSERLQAVFRFANAVVTSRAELPGVRVDSTMLRAARSDAAWRQERDGLRDELADWRQRASRMTLIYAPATAVWKQWLSSEGIIGRLVASIASNTEDDVSIKESLSELHTQRDFNKHVKVTDRNLIGRQRGPDIEARALKQLYEHAQIAVDLGRRHLSLRASQPANRAPETIVALTRLLDRVQRLGSLAADELHTISNNRGPTLLVAAASTAAYAIDRFRTFLQAASDQEPDPQDILASALFPYPTIPIGADGLSACDDQSALDTLITSEPLDLDFAAMKRLESGDFRTTRQMLRWIESNDLDHSDNIRRVLTQELQRRRRDLRHDIDDTRARITTAFSREHIQDAQRTTYEAQLVEMERRAEQPEFLDYEAEYAVLRKITHDIDTALDQLRTKAHSHLRRSGIEPDSSRYAGIVDAIKRGDIITANEVIGRPEAINFLVDTAPPNPFVDFYPSRSEAIRKEIEDRPAPQVIREVTTSDVFGGMELTSVSREQRESAGRMLTAWYALRRAGRLSDSAKGHIETLLSEIRFVVRQIRLTSRSHRDLAEAFVETDPLDTREQCPIPEFGSSVSGRYRIVFLWRSPTAEDILQHANSGDRRQATIVLYFAALDASRRAVLARLTRERSRSLLIVDDVLILYLCGAVGSRMPVLFGCSLPFTYVQPYVTSAGLVPPEMFYGREREIEEIAAPNESCFIYGGRQLGKTALLRQVEKKYHRPANDTYAIWIDLKRDGVGYDRVYEHGVRGVWSTIWRALNAAMEMPDDVMDPNPNTPNIRRRIDDFVNFLEGYFRRESGRRLLLLLDEADKFLEVDARQVQGRPGTEYRESAQLKGLMDATERSIKVVFAGLHNVLRTAESSNHPLGHFGTPIQIRPLWRDARALILEPLTAAGYRLDENLVVRVLARTNYYPHLIQLYGSDLVKSMANRVVDAPPFPIPESLVDDTYLKDTNLRQEFRQRFRLTLQLDPRYEVIAYTVAYECNERHSALSDGLDFRQIDEKARSCWPEGFDDFEPGTDRFRSLLDEMDGLGVLRKVDDHRYTLRNPNVLMLMGSSEEILETLLRPRNLPQETDPATFRAHDPSGGDSSPSRNPLTYQQEGSLRAMKNGVSIVCGLPASGYDDVPRFLSRSGFVVQLFDEKEFRDPLGVGSLTRRQFGDTLVSHYDGRSEGTTIYVVSSAVPWDKEWVGESLERVHNLNVRGRRDKNVRVLFMANATRLLNLYSAREGLDDLSFQGRLEWVPLRPWRAGFLLQWMNDLGIPDATEKCPKIIHHTGGWWALLQRFYHLVMKEGDFDVGLERLDSWLVDSSNRPLIDEQFGLDCIGSRREVLRDLTEYGAADFTELRTFAEDRGVGADNLRNILRWAELLHIVRRAGAKWEIDSVVGRLLTGSVL